MGKSRVLEAEDANTISDSEQGPWVWPGRVRPLVRQQGFPFLTFSFLDDLVDTFLPPFLCTEATECPCVMKTLNITE